MDPTDPNGMRADDKKSSDTTLDHVTFELLKDDEFDDPNRPAPAPGGVDLGGGLVRATKYAQMPADRVSVFAASLRTIVLHGDPIVSVATDPQTLQDRIDQMNEGSQLIAEVAGRGVMAGCKELDALHQNGALRGFRAYYGTEILTSVSGVASWRSRVRSRGLLTSAGLTFPRGWRTRAGHQPRVVVFGAGNRGILQEVQRQWADASGFDTNHTVFCFVSVEGDAQARIGAFLELNKSAVRQTWPGIEKTEGWKEYEEVMALPHLPPHLRRERDDYGVPR